MVVAHDLFEESAWRHVCQQLDSVLRFSFGSWQEVLDASVEPWAVAFEGSQHRQYLLSSAHVPSYSMLGILSGASPSPRTAQHAHKITEAATLVKQLSKRPYREAWGTCKEAWGFAGSFGCLQCLSLKSIQQRLKLRVKPIHPWTIGEPPEFHHSNWFVKRRLSRTFKSVWQTAAAFAKLELESLVDSSICSMQRRHWQAVWTICFKAKQCEMQSTNTFAQSCAPSKKSSLGPSQSWACRTHDNIKWYLFDPQIL